MRTIISIIKSIALFILGFIIAMFFIGCSAKSTYEDPCTLNGRKTSMIQCDIIEYGNSKTEHKEKTFKPNPNMTYLGDDGKRVVDIKSQNIGGCFYVETRYNNGESNFEVFCE